MMTVFTTGYEGTDINKFIATLKAAGVEHLADVRAVAISRKPGFSKKALSTNLNEAGIHYSHLASLGDPKPGRDAAKAGDYATFKRIYSKHLKTEGAQTELLELMDIAKRRPTCLLCFERDPKHCHRSLVISRMKQLYSFNLLDLYCDNPDRYVLHCSKIARHDPCESFATA